MKQVSRRVYLDTLANNYTAIEENLWSKINGKKFPLNDILQDIYEEHYRILGTSFNETGTIWALGIREYKDVIDKILSINSTTFNAYNYLENESYDLLKSLSNNTIKDMQMNSDYLYRKAIDKTFWNRILTKVKSLLNQIRMRFIFSLINCKIKMILIICMLAHGNHVLSDQLR